MITISPLVVGAVGALITLLLGVNAFFIKMLVNKVYTTWDVVSELKTQVAVLATQFENFKMLMTTRGN